MELKIDKERVNLGYETGIFVRAKGENGWESADIAKLDKESLVEWLTHEDTTPFNVIGVLLGYELPLVELVKMKDINKEYEDDISTS